MSMFRVMSAVVVSIAVAAAGCSSHDNSSCDPVANTGCQASQVCEQKQGGGSICAEPLVLQGHILNLADGSAVAGARVVALDANSAPVSSVVTSAADGSYQLPIPATRSSDGKPVSGSITLRVDASGFQSFPGGIRQALPISITSPLESSGKLVI